MMRDSQTGLYEEKYFNEFLALESRRRGRTEGQELLLLADLSAFTDVSERQRIAQSMMDVFSRVTRDTDVKGWHVDGMVIGVMFTEMTCEEASPSMVQRYVVNKCLRSLESLLGVERFSRFHISWQPLHSEHISKIHSASKR
jgi:hypothetical protein